MAADTRALILRLNAAARGQLERAAAHCVQKTHFQVEPEHLLWALLHPVLPGFSDVLQAHALQIGTLQRDLDSALESFKTGNERTPAFSQQLSAVLEEAWLKASVSCGETAVRPHHLLWSMVTTDAVAPLLAQSAPTLLRIPMEALEKWARGHDSSEGSDRSIEGEENSALKQFCQDLTESARLGRLDPVVGRTHQIQSLVEILMRRRQNNPILTGEAGVGKTAVVEGFAQWVAQEQVPPVLRAVRVLSLDLALLQAGAGMRGEFESRLKRLIEEVKQSTQPIVLFIDEAHQLIGAGGSEGVGDAANILKPALSRGELRTIAATTWSEYKQHIEKDPALARRFEVVQVNEPSTDDAEDMLLGMVPRLEKHHQVEVHDSAIRAAVALTSRYVSGRRLPDKAIVALDRACARVAQAQAGQPRALTEAQATCERDARSVERIERMQTRGEPVSDEARAAAYQRLQESQRHFNDLRTAIASGKAADIVPRAVDEETVAAVVSDWTGVPLGRLKQERHQTARSLLTQLCQQIHGQDSALRLISDQVLSHQAGLSDPNRPTGVFLLAGPSGVGKTETAYQLAELLYGGREQLILLNMTEFQEPHSVSGIKGSPPGYVGFGKGGALTEAVRRKPHALILLDEAEKAHPDVLELFYQVFDRGMLEDAEGTLVDFRQCLILVTTNLADTLIEQLCEDAPEISIEALAERLTPVLSQRLRPALMGRMTLIPFRPLSMVHRERIAKAQLEQAAERVRLMHHVPLTWDPKLPQDMAQRCAGSTGVRAISQLIRQSVLAPLASTLLDCAANGERLTEAHLTWNAGTQPIELRTRRERQS
ncbi:clpA ATP-binding subunits of Clp protease and DnaK/DnaJ chaperones [Burkholderiales bacterium]